MKFIRKYSSKLTGLLVLVGLAYAYFSWQESKVKYLSYQVVNSLKYVSLDELDAALIPYLSESFWDVNMQAVKASLEEIEWIKQASVRRNWPGYLDLEIEEHQPVARWDKNFLISKEGVVFKPASQADFENLILLSGDKLQAKELLITMLKTQREVKKLDWELAEMIQQIDGIIRIKFVNQQQLTVNAKDLEKKLTSFIMAYPKLPTKLVESAQNFDLRYSNGLAIKVTERE